MLETHVKTKDCSRMDYFVFYIILSLCNMTLEVTMINYTIFVTFPLETFPVDLTFPF